MPDNRRKYDWKAIQAFYDVGNSCKECEKHFGFCRATAEKARKRKEFVRHRSLKEAAHLHISKHGATPLSEKTRQKIKDSVNRRLRDGTWHYSFSKVRTHKFVSKFAGEVKLMGKWELEYAKHLDNQNVRWERPIEKFAYEFEGVQRFYTPDFFLSNQNIFIEVKGYETAKDRAKWKYFPHVLKVLKYQDLINLGLTISTK